MHTHFHTHTCTHMHAHTFTHTHTRIRTHVHMHACMYTFMQNTHACAHTHSHMHAHTYIHAHTYARAHALPTWNLPEGSTGPCVSRHSSDLPPQRHGRSAPGSPTGPGRNADLSPGGNDAEQLSCTGATRRAAQATRRPRQPRSASWPDAPAWAGTDGREPRGPGPGPQTTPSAVTKQRRRSQPGGAKWRGHRPR